MQTEYKYKGYTYKGYEEAEFDGDCTKIWHDVQPPTGEQIHMDFTPYDFPTEKEFQIWIDLGRPGRIVNEYGSHNFGPDDLARMWEAWNRDKNRMDEIEAQQPGGPQPQGRLIIDGKKRTDAGEWVDRDANEFALVEDRDAEGNQWSLCNEFTSAFVEVGDEFVPVDSDVRYKIFGGSCPTEYGDNGTIKVKRVGVEDVNLPYGNLNAVHFGFRWKRL